MRRLTDTQYHSLSDYGKLVLESLHQINTRLDSLEKKLGVENGKKKER